MKTMARIHFCFLFLLAFAVAGTAAEPARGSGPRGRLNILFPEIKFDNVTLREAVGFLASAADVNIVIDPSVYASTAPPAAPSLPAAPSPRPSAPPITPDETRITLHLKNVPLGVVLKYILRYKNLRYIVDDYAIVIVPMGRAMPEELVTKVFRLRTGDIGSAAPFLPRAAPR
ncbi:MAG: hypothetical protein Q8Q12_07270 [bacterium]|nr:hypothetical protein [bacterium]